MTRPRTGSRPRALVPAALAALALAWLSPTAASAVAGPGESSAPARSSGDVASSMSGAHVHAPSGRAATTPPRVQASELSASDVQNTLGWGTQADSASSAALPAEPWDFNGDGNAELLTGAVLEDLGGAADAGSITVLPGTPEGAAATGSTAWSQNSPGVPGTAERGDQLGYASASGDFDKDGYADVAVSSNGESLSGSGGAGMVHVLYGSPDGLTAEGVQTLEPATFGRTRAEAFLGEGLAAGDFDGDGHHDLAVGAPGREFVGMLPGSTNGLDTTSAISFNQNTQGVPGSMSGFSEGFGNTLASGDANGDDIADLAVGAMLDDETRDYATGSVTMIYGSPSGPTPVGAQLWSKDTAGVDGAPHPFNFANGDFPDLFGFTLAMGDFDGDTFDDLAVGAPGSDVVRAGTRRSDAGATSVLQGSDSGITVDDLYMTEDSPGVPGTVGRFRSLGQTLAAGDTTADGSAELAVWVAGAPHVLVLTGTTGDLGAGTDLTFTQNTPGVPGSEEPPDQWGASLRIAAFDGDTGADLAVGAIGENRDAGSVTVLRSNGTGLTGTGARSFTQNTPGVPGSSEPGDWFGSFFS